MSFLNSLFVFPDHLKKILGIFIYLKYKPDSSCYPKLSLKFKIEPY